MFLRRMAEIDIEQPFSQTECSLPLTTTIPRPIPVLILPPYVFRARERNGSIDLTITQAFYIPNKDRPNLSVMVNATVYRVLTQQTGNGQLSAIGIEFDYDNQIYFVNAREEVILSAG